MSPNGKLSIQVFACSCVLMMGGLAAVSAQTVEWPAYGRDVEGTKYSPLEQINAENFPDLKPGFWTVPSE